MTLNELEQYLCRGDFRVEGDGERIWLEGPEGWRLSADDPPDTRLVLADEPDILRKMLPTLQCLHVLDRIASALTVCRGVSTSDLRRAARQILEDAEAADRGTKGGEDLDGRRPRAGAWSDLLGA